MSNFKEKLKVFWKEHKYQIILGGCMIVATSSAMYLGLRLGHAIGVADGAHAMTVYTNSMILPNGSADQQRLFAQRNAIYRSAAPLERFALDQNVMNVSTTISALQAQLSKPVTPPTV